VNDRHRFPFSTSIVKAKNEQKIPVIYRILPGAGLVSAGKKGLGLFFLLAFSSFTALFLLRFDLFVISVRSLFTGIALLMVSTDNFLQVFTPEILEFWVAALYIVIVPVLLSIFSNRAYRRTLAEKNGIPSGELSLWQLGMRSFRGNLIPVVASVVIFTLYSVSFLAPFLAPFSPFDQQDFLVTAYRPPLTRLDAIVFAPKRASMIPLREGKEASASLTNALIDDVRKLKSRNRDYALKFVDGYHVVGNNLIYNQGIRERIVPLAELRNLPAGPFSGDRPGFVVSRNFLLGTDQYGRDIFSRVIYGSRISLSIGFLVVLISVTLGTVIGVSSGYFGGWVDNVLMRLVDVLIAFPALFLILIIIATFGNSIYLIVITLSFTGWMGVARIVRGQVLSLKEQEFILAAKSLGLSHLRIIFRHLVPNALTPVIVAATLRIGSIILTEAGLSFLGLGVQPPTPSWGNIINEGRDSLLNHWWISTFPGIAILSTVVCFNLIGDGVRDALDPRMRG
jgi:peptide/nickel transport system permease protein